MKKILTGRYYFKRTLLGLVLMVEHEVREFPPISYELKWSKATEEDLAYLNIKIERIP